MGRGELSSHLLERSMPLREVESVLEREWPAAAVIVLDDADGLPADVVRSLLAVVRRRGGKIVLTSETPIPDQARLRAAGALTILALGGLDRAECRRLAPKGMSSEEFDKVYRLAAGNPLSIKLLAADALDELDARFNAEERALLRVLKLRQDAD